MTLTAWGLSYIILANGYTPNIDAMNYATANSREHCIELAKQKWSAYYSTDTYNRNLFTLCHKYPHKTKSDMFWVSCNPNGDCVLTTK